MLRCFLGDKRGIVDLSKDKIVIVEHANNVLGLLAARQVHWIHEFRIVPSLVSRSVADALINYAISSAVTFNRSRNLPDPEAMFMVKADNAAFLRAVREMKCAERETGQLFSLDLR